MSRRSSSITAERGTPFLPRLPVPNLRLTLQKYVKSLEPLLQEEESRGGLPVSSALNSRQQWASEFENGVGSHLQQRLVGKSQLDKRSPRNWLDDNIWLKKAYHEWRSPLVINSNWWLAFFNDSSVPEDVLRGQSPSGTTGFNPWQIRRAAWLIHRTLEFKDRLQRQELYPDTTRTGIWFRENVAKMFYTCRIPQIGCDALSPQPSPSELSARKILVMVHDWFYAIEVYNEDLTAIGAPEIERRLRRVAWDAAQRLKFGEQAFPVGLLSSDDRDSWAKNLEYLLSLSPRNVDTFDTIKKSVIALSLDDHTYGISTADASTRPPIVESREEIDFHLHNIRSSRNARNRWFDKAFTFIVETNSRAGAMGEHSPCDALVPSIVAEYAIIENIDPAAFDHPIPSMVSNVGSGSGWERLDWITDDHVVRECDQAGARAQKLITDSDDSVLWFSDYGADWIKGVARLAPDAYVQMALQLAWYKTRGTFTATYETVLTRLFDRGRTETIRTLTSDSRAFVLTMVDPSTSLAERQQRLRRAIQTHTSLTREAATGKGIDRHLLGLCLMLQPGERSDLFEDPLFEQSQTWKLSTSGLSAGHLFRGTGFGASYQDGYGINYLSGPHIIKFGIESKHSCPETSTALFQAALSEALRDMRTVCSPESVEGNPPALARL
ncbi:acyltransferase ChoActase/COT/CPT [Artomyces pyxidatus]|uniref:Acyltransferase ChoActase/COT/CPT n=1 Tax=Artomyces pyxidatus TaxID=48021 RepID=A0ACB8TL15_9AGAM|nr:acyltransferase ChoActase/COT/CPT [Artomyces pyxidatus]